MQKARKTLFILGILFGTVCAGMAQTAQIEKGTGMVSLDIPFAIRSYRFSNGNESSNSIEAKVRPVFSGGYFVARNFMVGAGFGFTQEWSRTKYSSGVGKHRPAALMNPTVVLRYYHMFTPKVGIYGQFTAEGDIWKRKESSLMGARFIVSPHMVFFPKPDWGINVGFGELGYGYSLSKYAANTSQRHDLIMDASLSVGFSYFIRKKK